jgi:hypothetical protein
VSTEAETTEEQLATCESLEGATMPNGQKYEESLKSKSHEEDGEHSDLSNFHRTDRYPARMR